MTLNIASLFAASMGLQSLSVEEWLGVMRFPFDHDSRIWRYMRIKYFVDLLQRRALYFRRLDRLEDQFEGAFSDDAFEQAAKDLVPIARHFGIEHPEGVDDLDAALLAMLSSEESMRASTFINCWHRNDYESFAMWKLFARDSETNHGGIAILSTKGRLWKSVTPDQQEPVAVMGDVAYYDRRTESMPSPCQWVCKDQMFSWEKEVRISTFNSPTEYGVMGFNADHPDGLHLPTDLHLLIEAVVLPPGSEQEEHARMRNLLDEFGLPHVPVLPSAADIEPYYRPYLERNREIIRERGIEMPVHRSKPEPEEQPEQEA